MRTLVLHIHYGQAVVFEINYYRRRNYVIQGTNNALI